MSKVKY